jgi:hypothetical protein
MLLYFQPWHEADQRRCFVAEPPASGDGLVELKTGSTSAASDPHDPAGPLCVHLSPAVTSIYLATE